MRKEVIHTHAGLAKGGPEDSFRQVTWVIGDGGVAQTLHHIAVAKTGEAPHQALSTTGSSNDVRHSYGLSTPHLTCVIGWWLPGDGGARHVGKDGIDAALTILWSR